jgi:hypothetical protein
MSATCLAARVARRIWAGPCSAVGLLLVVPALLLGGSARRIRGTLEVSWRADDAAPAWWERHLPFSAITFGHVIIGASPVRLAELRNHERVHVRQYERWGILFLVAYPLSSMVQLLKGRRPYWDNRFEVEAYAAQRRDPYQS